MGIFIIMKPCMSVHHIFSQIIKLNQSIRRSNLSCYQAILNHYWQNESLHCRENTEAALEVAFRCIYTLFSAGHECI